MLAAARDSRLNERERDAAKESLRQIAESDGSAAERGRAETALIELGVVMNPGETAAQGNRADMMAEQFFLQYQLDPLSERFLRHVRHTSFLDVTDAQVADFMQREWSAEPDAKVHDEKYKRLKAVWDAATLVRARFAMVYESIDRRISELLGLDVGCDPESGLADAKEKYAKAAANLDAR
jgi:hypothetical protein